MWGLRRRDSTTCRPRRMTEAMWTPITTKMASFAFASTNPRWPSSLSRVNLALSLHSPKRVRVALRVAPLWYPCARVVSARPARHVVFMEHVSAICTPVFVPVMFVKSLATPASKIAISRQPRVLDRGWQGQLQPSRIDFWILRHGPFGIHANMPKRRTHADWHLFFHIPTRTWITCSTALFWTMAVCKPLTLNAY